MANNREKYVTELNRYSALTALLPAIARKGREEAIGIMLEKAEECSEKDPELAAAYLSEANTLLSLMCVEQKQLEGLDEEPEEDE